MSKTSIIVVIILVILAILGFHFFAPDSWKFWGQTANVIDTTVDTSSQASEHETITAKHQYKNGKHIVAGEANSPTPCDILSASATVTKSLPEQVTINFTSTSTDSLCAQVITSNRFKVEFSASENATVKATWNGKPVGLNLIPAGENEDLGNFELFIKG